MEDVVRHFGSFEAAEAADIEEDLAMTPGETGGDRSLELQARIYPDADQQGFARVYRITQRQKN
jgi:hypothetical protein